MPATIEELNTRLQQSPFNHWLNLRTIAIDAQGVTLESPIRSEMMGSRATGAVHGGIVAAMIDTVCSFAWLAMHEGRVVTIDLRVDFHRPMMPGLIRLRGTLISAGRSIVTADARIVADNRLVASGRAVMKPYPAEA